MANTAETTSGGDFENADTDGDGMADGFESTHHLLVDSNDAALDPDADGQSNLAEYTAGTDPKNAGSLLKITAAAFAPSTRQITIEWPSVPGRLYRIEHKANLTDSTWNEIATHSANSSTSSLSLSALANHTRGFYRISTRR